MFSKLRALFSELSNKLTKVKLSGQRVDRVLSEMELMLIANDVAVPVAEKICSDLKSKISDKKIGLFEDVKAYIKNQLRGILSELLVDGYDSFVNLLEEKRREKKPAVLLFVGVNGCGKTTTIAKIAKFLVERGFSVVLTCSDTFRAGAIEQLETHSKRIGVPIIKRPYGSDPASVAYDAINYAKTRGINVVLIDTAGRTELNKNLLDELRKIKRVSSPDVTILVLDALTGNAAVAQAEEYDRSIGIDAFILAKVDADDKGGLCFSVSYITKKPIIFIGTGQGYDDLKAFNSEIFVSKVLGD